MGRDLKLLPVQGTGECLFAHTIIGLDRDSSLFGAIDDADQHELDPTGDFHTHLAHIESGENEGEHCYGPVSNDAYDVPLAWVYASTLARLLLEKGRGMVKNRAAGAYLAVLDPNTRVVLYWD